MAIYLKDNCQVNYLVHNKNSDSSYTLTLLVTSVGTGTAHNVVLNTVNLGTAMG